MSITSLVTILDPSASPQTGVADGDSQIIKVGPIDPNRGGADTLYPIVFSADYESGTGTLTPHICNDPADSPRVWVQVKMLQSDGTDAAITRTADFNLVVDAHAESLLKWTISAGSSPVIHMTARGVCRRHS